MLLEITFSKCCGGQDLIEVNAYMGGALPVSLFPDSLAKHTMRSTGKPDQVIL